MKKIKITYWIFTGLFAAMMLLSSIPDIIKVPEAIEIFKHLGYPEYLIRFLGVAKLLGVVAVLYPGFPRLKEWAYAGIFFDVTGALYSPIALGDPASKWAPIFIVYVLLFASYFYYHKMRQIKVGY